MQLLSLIAQHQKNNLQSNHNKFYTDIYTNLLKIFKTLPAAPANTCLKNFRLRRRLTSQCRCQRDKKFSACGAQTCLQREKKFSACGANVPTEGKRFSACGANVPTEEFFFLQLPVRAPTPPPPRALTSGGKEVTSSPDPDTQECT